ncbi:MAG TPA: hypothetical protein VFA26_22090 [Gemmataceae bacterium]|nr:hypothetical protein [Gemmataceae bacterium]
MFLRRLCAGLALLAVLLTTGCNCCHRSCRPPCPPAAPACCPGGPAPAAPVPVSAGYAPGCCNGF